MIIDSQGRRIFQIDVKDKIASLHEKSDFGVCGNSDYVIRFLLDDEWDASATKTARFVHAGGYRDVVFEGNECGMPIVANSHFVKIGLFAGNLRTTTAAFLQMKKSVTSEDGMPEDPGPSVYAQLLEVLDLLSVKVMPEGGTEGQVLTKTSDEDYDTEWGDQTGGGAVRSVNGQTGAVVLDAQDVGALSEDTEIPEKTSDLVNDSGFLTAHQSLAAYRTSAEQDTIDAGKLAETTKGAAGGVAELDTNGKVPQSQLPSYVDDVVEYATTEEFPATGESGKIYVATNTNLTYRWSGSAYTEISPSIALGETASTAYRGDRGKTAYDWVSANGAAAIAHMRNQEIHLSSEMAAFLSTLQTVDFVYTAEDDTTVTYRMVVAVVD